MTASDDNLDQLIHDAHSKCTGLKTASELLRKASKNQARELLSLMAEEVRNLSRIIASLERAVDS